jgi:uncharacterized protein
MLEVIEKLLILQDRDRKLLQLSSELARIVPERQALIDKSKSRRAVLDAAKNKANHIESERKRLELEVDERSARIEKYSLQQFQTKKNEEYKALSREIQNCKVDIEKLEDQQLELMEQADSVRIEIKDAEQEDRKFKEIAEQQIEKLNQREANLGQELTSMQAGRTDLAQAVEKKALAQYERCSKNKARNVIVGIDGGVCGGCHMKLPIQISLSCKAQQELVSCPNCGRILYYQPGMSLRGND